MKNTCSVEGCNKPRDRKGWCSMHYTRMHNHGELGPAEAFQPEKVALTCEHCSKDFEMTAGRYRVAVKFFGGRKYCTRTCWKEALAIEALERPAPTFECAQCKKVVARKRTPKTGQYNLQPKFCGRECASLAGKHNAGLPLHVKQRDGYILVCQGGRRAKYVPQHRIVMERAIDRPLRKEETVHHKNGQRDDNRIENLELWNSRHGKGQRVSDKIEFCAGFLREYGYDPMVPTVSEYISGITGLV